MHSPAQDEPSPSHTSHSSTTAEPPHSSLQSKTLPAQSHAPSAIPSPLQTPHSSTTASPPHTSLQSVAKELNNSESAEQSSVYKVCDASAATTSKLYSAPSQPTSIVKLSS